MNKRIEQLIINSPYIEPKQYWSYSQEIQRFEKIKGRRPARYTVLNTRNPDDDLGEFKPLDLVNKMRKRVEVWRKDGYPGLSGVSSRLWQYWNDYNRDKRLFYCQLEAIETLLFLIQAPDNYKVNLDIPSDGCSFARWCNKMATGTGKTIVMAMLIALNILNKIAYPKDVRFSKNILIVAPNLTVKNRLDVLQPHGEKDNYYDAFDLVPTDLKQKLNLGKIKIINWHVLNISKKSQYSNHKVVKIGQESKEAFTRRVLEDMKYASNILVINDEAHHAWRLKTGEGKSFKKFDLYGDTTNWIKGLEIIHDTRKIIRCHDLSATPFRPVGLKNKSELLFDWIVSDFGLNDAIESGLVKTPRLVLKSDDSQSNQYGHSIYRHIYNQDDVKDNLNSKKTDTPLPEIVRHAYRLLSSDWQKTKDSWTKAHHVIPPAMISICNTTNTAARIEESIKSKNLPVSNDLLEISQMVRIDSRVFKEAEEKVETDTHIDASRTKDEYFQHLKNIILTNQSLSDRHKQCLLEFKKEDLLREIVDSVGKKEQAGEQISHVISVDMLSEGWDAKNVTHIMGLRAFASQLLCEQVVGRGLRRMNYEINQSTQLLDPEYVNIFGVPFAFLPTEDNDNAKAPKITIAPQRIEIIPERNMYEISWPNVERIENVFLTTCNTDIDDFESKILHVSDIASKIESPPHLDGLPKGDSAALVIDLKESNYRLQTVVFKIASLVINKIKNNFIKYQSIYDLSQKIINLTTEFIYSNKISFQPAVKNSDEKHIIFLSAKENDIANHIFKTIENDIKSQPVKKLVLSQDHPIGKTGDMKTWYTRREFYKSQRSHISHAVADSNWELKVAQELDDPFGLVGKNVKCWVKNENLNFEIKYVYQGMVHSYHPDFLIKLNNNEILVLEVKGRETFKDQAKFKALQDWICAVNQDGRWGKWYCDILLKSPSNLSKIMLKYKKI